MITIDVPQSAYADETRKLLGRIRAACSESPLEFYDTTACCIEAGIMMLIQDRPHGHDRQTLCRQIEQLLVERMRDLVCNAALFLDVEAR